MNTGYSMLWFWAAYAAVTLVGIGHTIFNWKVLKMENAREVVTSMYDITAYAKTLPFHPLYNILIWPVCAWFYFIQTNPADLWREAFILGISWTVIIILIDLIGWVVIKHPWRMTVREMYVDYQPWITLIYITVLISPFAAAFFV